MVFMDERMCDGDCFSLVDPRTLERPASSELDRPTQRRDSVSKARSLEEESLSGASMFSDDYELPLRPHESLAF